MSNRPHISYSVTSETEPASTNPDRDLTIKIRRVHTNQTEIDFSIKYSTSPNGHLTDETTALMEDMLGYHDIFYPVSERIIGYASRRVASIVNALTDYAGTHLRPVLWIKDFNPNATYRLDVQVAIMDLRSAIREYTPELADKVCTICLEKFEEIEVVNSLKCNHIYHLLCIADWVCHSLSCPTCRETHI